MITIRFFILSKGRSILECLGISICAFYGNFFVRSTDLISLANVNPGELRHKLTSTLRLYFQDSTVGIELRIDQALTNQEGVLFQAALLYSTTTGKSFEK